MVTRPQLLSFHHFSERLFSTSHTLCHFIPHSTLTFILIFVSLIYAAGPISHLLLSPTFSYGFIKEGQQTYLHRWVFGGKVGALACIHHRHCAQLVSPRQHPDITAGVTNGYDTPIPFSHSRLSLLAHLPCCDIPRNTINLTAAVENIYFQSLTYSILEL